MKGSTQTKYMGLTRKEYKQRKAVSCSEQGKNKSVLCQATSLQKAMFKYPRSIKTDPDNYFRANLAKDIAARRNSFFTQNS